MFKNKGMWKRTFSIFKNFKIPWHLYIIEAILALISTKIALELIPYSSSLKTGNVTEEGVLSGFILFSLLNMFVSFIAAIPSFYASSIVQRNLQKKMIYKMLAVPMKKLEEFNSLIVSWVTNDCMYANGLITTIIGFFTGSASALMTVKELNQIHKSFVFILPVIVIYMIISYWIEGKLLFLRQKRERGAESEITAFFAEHLGFFKNIKQLHAYDEEVKRAHQAIEKAYHADVYMTLLTALINLVGGPIQQMITILVFALGVPIVRNGQITMDELVQTQTYILIAYQSISCIPSLYTSLQYYNGQLFYIANLLASEEEIVKSKVGMDRDDEEIRFENIHFAYDETEILKNVSFIIPKGKITALIGPNGSGKTTIFKLCERFYVPNQGNIFFGNLNIKDIHLDEWRQSIGYVLQEPMLYNATIRENVSYGLDREVKDEEIMAALKLACADQFVSELENGLDFIIGDNGSRLSAGQRQRIAIARTIMMDPAYLLLDEATCNLDVYSEKEVTKALFQLMNKRTTIMISHDKNMIEKANHFVVLNDGNIEICGNYEEVKENHLFQQLCQ